MEALGALAVWIIRMVAWVAIGIASYNRMEPDNFWSVIWWLIIWHIVVAAVQWLVILIVGGAISLFE